MSTYRLIELQRKSSWDPAELLSSAFRWPTDWPLAQLADVTVRLNPRVFVDRGTQVITPGGIDIQYGGVRKRSLRYQGAAFQVGGNHQDLQHGDLILPRNPEIPPLLIGPSLDGAIISDGFYAFRPTGQLSGTFLWALFSSKSGRDLRRALSFGVSHISTLKLDEIAIPLPSVETQTRIQTYLAEISARLEDMEVEAATTWWSTANLQELSWQLALATPRPEQLSFGSPLTDHASIFSGKRIDRDALLDNYKPGLLPVTNKSTLSGRMRPRWTEQTANTVTAIPGDVLVASVGDQANARVVEETTVIEQSILLVRPNRSDQAVKIAAYLNSRAGQAHRQILLSGALIPRVLIRDLAKIPIPENLFEVEAVNAPLMPLADELEELLWAS